ncbi:MAG: transposase [Cyanobacteria bacterium J06635_1]
MSSPAAAEREIQIQRVQTQTFQQRLNQQLETDLRDSVVKTVERVLEAALVEEVKADLAQFEGSQPRRSGYYSRRVDTQYGRIDQLLVPKLRGRNRERTWQILERYQRGIRGFLDWVCYLYVLGLSLRDLQVLLYWQLGQVLSRNAINRVTLRVQEQMLAEQQARIERTPSVVIVDGVWVEIQYATGEIKLDRAGHQRQERAAQERVILAVMAVWADGSHQMLHYEIALKEDTDSWKALLKHLIERGLDPSALKVIVSDGAKGLLTAMAQYLPDAQQQRCITHKIRGLVPYLSYENLPTTDETGHPLDEKTARQQRKTAFFDQAYDIYKAPDYQAAQQRKQAFIDQWQALEPKAIHAFQTGLERTFVFYQLDETLHRAVRTTNLLERFFREFRAKADEVGAFPNEHSCLALFFLVKQLEHANHDRPGLANNSGH